MIEVLEAVLSAKTTEFERAIGNSGKALSQLNAKVLTSQALLKGMAGKLMTFAAIGGTFAMTKQVMNTVDATAKLSDRLGVSVRELQGFRHAANLSGVGAERMTYSLENMGRRLEMAASMGGESAKALEKLGLSASRLKSMAPTDAFRAIAEGIKRLPNAAERASVAMDLFGRSGMSMITMFNEGKAGLDAAQKEVDELGAAISRVDAKRIEALNESITTLQLAVSARLQNALISVADALTSVFQMASRLTASPLMGWVLNTTGLFLAFRTALLVTQAAKWVFVGTVMKAIVAVKTLTASLLGQTAAYGSVASAAMTASSANASYAITAISVRRAHAAGAIDTATASSMLSAMGKTLTETGGKAGLFALAMKACWGWIVKVYTAVKGALVGAFTFLTSTLGVVLLGVTALASAMIAIHGIGRRNTRIAEEEGKQWLTYAQNVGAAERALKRYQELKAGPQNTDTRNAAREALAARQEALQRNIDMLRGLETGTKADGFFGRMVGGTTEAEAAKKKRAFADLRKTMEAALRSMAKDVADLDKAINLQESIDKSTKALEEQANVLRYGEEQWQRMQLAAKGATKDQVDALKKAQEGVAGAQIESDIRSYAESVAKAAEAVHMTAEEEKKLDLIYRMRKLPIEEQQKYLDLLNQASEIEKHTKKEQEYKDRNTRGQEILENFEKEEALVGLSGPDRTLAEFAYERYKVDPDDLKLFDDQVSKIKEAMMSLKQTTVKQSISSTIDDMNNQLATFDMTPAEKSIWGFEQELRKAGLTWEEVEEQIKPLRKKWAEMEALQLQPAQSWAGALEYGSAAAYSASLGKGGAGMPEQQTAKNTEKTAKQVEKTVPLLTVIADSSKNWVRLSAGEL